MRGFQHFCGKEAAQREGCLRKQRTRNDEGGKGEKGDNVCSGEGRREDWASVR